MSIAGWKPMDHTLKSGDRSQVERPRLMIQCPACSSFNDPEAAFCNQCGRPFSRSRKGVPRLRRGKRAVEIAVLAVLIAALGYLVWYQFLGGKSHERRKPTAARAARPFESGPRSAERPPEERRAADAEPLSAEALRKVVDPAIVLLDLLDERGARLREVRGIVLEASGSVLCRFRPLLGAHGGTCKTSRPGEPAREIRGLIAFDPNGRNLALLEVRWGGEGAAGLSTLPREVLREMAPGMAVAVASVGKVVLSRIAETGHPSSDGISHILLADDPPLPANALVVLDPLAGEVIGLCSPEPSPSGERQRLLADSMVELSDLAGRPASLSLSEVSRRYYEGTFADFLDRGRRALEVQDLAAASDLLQKALDQAEREPIGEDDFRAAQDLLRRVIEEDLERRRREKDSRGVAAVLAVAVVRFPQERGYWLDLGAARLDLEDLPGAIEALLEARRLQPGSDAEALLLRAYLAGSAREVSVGRLQVAAEWLEKGIQVLPGSAKLHLELARLYQRWGFYDDASRVYLMARAMDPGLGPEVDAALEEIEESIRRREALVLKIPEGSTTIQTDAVVNDRATYRFIIDTGATFTSISREMAQGLGYPLGPGLEQVLIGTANGVVSAPIVLLDSVNLQGYSVRNLKAVVLPQRAMSTVGLLGLNFLDHFRYSVDAGRREFRLEKR